MKWCYKCRSTHGAQDLCLSNNSDEPQLPKNSTWGKDVEDSVTPFGQRTSHLKRKLTEEVPPSATKYPRGIQQPQGDSNESERRCMDQQGGPSQTKEPDTAVPCSSRSMCEISDSISF